jgi:hypothetical protein
VYSAAAFNFYFIIFFEGKYFSLILTRPHSIWTERTEKTKYYHLPEHIIRDYCFRPLVYVFFFFLLQRPAGERGNVAHISRLPPGVTPTHRFIYFQNYIFGLTAMKKLVQK